MDSRAKKELRSLLRQARKDGRKPFAGYIKEGDGSIHVLLLADASEFVYRRLKRFEPDPAGFLPGKMAAITTSSK